MFAPENIFVMIHTHDVGQIKKDIKPIVRSILPLDLGLAQARRPVLPD